MAKRDHNGQPVWSWRCVVCNKPMFQLTATNFSHILPKGSYTRWIAAPFNIVIKCSGCHYKWHRVGRTILEHKDTDHHMGWRAMFAKSDELKEQYNRGE